MQQVTQIQKQVEISIVIPACNEAENLPILIPEIEEALRPLARGFEVIIIDDGSTDATAGVIEDMASLKPFVQGIFFDQNYGQTAALKAGIAAACGDCVVFIDADLQNDPADIPRLLEKLDEFDAAVGWRVDRHDPWTKKLTSRFANLVRRLATGDPTHDTACSLKAFRGDTIRKMKLFDGMHRFLSMLAAMEGARVVEVKINHRPRRFGRSKYSIFNRFLRPILDLLAVMWMKRRTLRYRVKEGEGGQA